MYNYDGNNILLYRPKNLDSNDCFDLVRSI